MRLAALFLSLGLAAAPVRAQGTAAPAGKVPQGGQLVSLSLVEALTEIGHADLIGVFSFVSAEQAPAAMADFLLRNRKAMKRYIKKVERDKKAAEAISHWDKQTFLFMTGLIRQAGSGQGVKKISKRWLARIHALALAPGAPLQMIVQKRGNT